MTTATRWGILGTGSIAKQFARGLADTPDAVLQSVGSRAQDSADAFGEAFSIPTRHASYEALANDPDVDAIYVSTPPPFHKDNSILCLRAGKAVLCEKPFTINAAEAKAVVEVARERGVFLMEAMWSRFFPAMQQVKKWLDEGAIGEVRLVNADFGFRAGINPEGRLFNPGLGGGALLDVGIYATSFASFVLGPHPTRIESMAHIGETGVDEQNALILGYENGAMALLSSAIRTSTPHEATIVGTEGTIRIPTHFWRAAKASLKAGDREEEVEFDTQGNGYNYEAAEVGRCLREGLLESPTMPLDETIALMHVLDAVRAQWGLTYPME